jgi:hypothetical protein
MPRMTWTKDPSTVSQDYQARHGPNSLDPLFMWATHTVEALYYLGDLDKIQANPTNSNSPHDPVIVDMAHVRWATTTTITALDLCAAGLGRQYCNWTIRNEPDLRDFKQANNRRQLPPSALQWVDAVLTDPRYKNVLNARNSLTHSRLIRHFVVNLGSSTPDPRTAFNVNGSRIEAGTLVATARDFAGEQVDAFLLVIDAL